MEKATRPKITRGPAIKIVTGCGNLYVIMGYDESGKLIEIFARLGKAGGCATCQNEALTRAITLGLKYGIPVNEFVDELKGIQCPFPVWSEGIYILSCSDAIAKVLARKTTSVSVLSESIRERSV